MADQSLPRPINAPFPAPPPFWKHFTEENISKLEEAVKTQVSSSDKRQTPKAEKLKPAELRELTVPPELSYLIPPAPPVEESYKVFSNVISLSSAPLPEGIEKLFPDPQPTNPAPHLLRITKSILLNFLELCSMLSLDSSLAAQKKQDFVTLFINAHHFINLYRPHQARETLIGMLEAKVEEGKKELEQLDAWEGEVTRWLDQLQGEGSAVRKEDDAVSATGEASGPSKENGRLRDESEAKRLWELISEIEDEGAIADDG